MHIASMLGGQFSFITVFERIRPTIRHLAAAHGIAEHYIAFAAVNVPVIDPMSLCVPIADAWVKQVSQSKRVHPFSGKQVRVGYPSPDDTHFS